ncbi:hypothetical protein Tco_0216487 [Tanacetum coccineum]
MGAGDNLQELLRGVDACRCLVSDKCQCEEKHSVTIKSLKIKANHMSLARLKTWDGVEDNRRIGICWVAGVQGKVAVVMGNLMRLGLRRIGKGSLTQKLNDWKNKSLSYAGRAQLIASVLGSMQVYWGLYFYFLRLRLWLLILKSYSKDSFGIVGRVVKGRQKWLEKMFANQKIKEGRGSIKLKMRSVWDVAADSKDSWVWKSLLSLRDWVGKHMRYKVGNGKSNNVWYDKWNDGDYLSKNISKKKIFYGGFNDQTKLVDVMDSDGWKWSADWFLKYLWISSMKTPILNNCPDKAVWVDSNGIERRFCTNTVWKDVRKTIAKLLA